ncbi:MAG TPA: radical SAM protein [Pyrinomonadaceae bacterium]|nr:radical SAM protein [Pyrinomonadaceae bacterium]
MQGPIGDDYRVLQIHPTLRCNLKCPHCYSSSSPEEVAELPLDLLRQTLSEAFAEGYNAVGVSGGEPLMFSSLHGVLEQARSLGMVTTVTTNGLLLDRKRLRDLRELVDLIAISLDGIEASHNRMRGNPRAFELMKKRLEDVRDAQVKFAFIFTLTMHNLHELEQVASFAVEQGASLLQVHPLEEVGRAQSLLAGSSPDDLELSYAFLECARVKQMYADKLQLQFDVADREVVRDYPCKVYADERTDLDELCRQPLGDLVSTLIVENDGFVVPIQYGFARAYGLGSLRSDSFRDLAARWKADVYPSFRQLCRRVFEQMVATASPSLPFTNWYGLVMESSYTSTS